MEYFKVEMDHVRHLIAVEVTEEDRNAYCQEEEK